MWLVWANPCAEGEPAQDVGGRRPQECGNYFGSSGCPAGFFCHVGATQDDSVCCPSSPAPFLSFLPLPPALAGLAQARTRSATWASKWAGATGSWPGGSSTPAPASARLLPTRAAAGTRTTSSRATTASRPALVPPSFARLDREETKGAWLGEWENPCAVGEPEKEGSSFKNCALFLGPNAGCSFGYFCLSGDPSEGEPNYCCPTMGDACASPKTDGQGRKSLQRFKYSPSPSSPGHERGKSSDGSTTPR